MMGQGMANASKANVTFKGCMKGKHDIEKGIVYSQRSKE
jgi:hypothetical protein